MKKRSYYFLLMLLLCGQICTGQDRSFYLKATAGYYDNRAMAYLRYGLDNQLVKDSVQINGHQFSFRGNIPFAVEAIIIVRPNGPDTYAAPGNWFHFYLEPGTCSIISPDSMANAKISGGRMNDEDKVFKVLTRPFTSKIDSMEHLYVLAYKEKVESEKNMKNLEKKLSLQTTKKREFYANYIRTHSDQLYSLLLLKKYGGVYPNINEVTPLFATLSPRVRNSVMGRNYQEEVDRLRVTSNGALAIDFSQADINGRTISLKDYNGKYLFIDFWASWCGPCRNENPNLRKAYGIFKDKGVEFLGISLDSSKSLWLKAVKEDDLPWKQVSDLKGYKNEAASAYHVKGIPQNFLISPDGKIIAQNLRGGALISKLNEIFGNK